MGGQFVPWRRAPNRPDRGVASDPLRDWEAEGEGGGLIRLLDRISVGPAAAYAADTAEELRRQPADVVVSCDLLFGPMLAAEATGTRLALFGPNISFVTPIPGIPPIGPGMMPPVTPEEHTQAAAVHAWFAEVMAAQLPVLNAARAGFGLRPLADAFSSLRRRIEFCWRTSRAFDFPRRETCRSPCTMFGPLLEQPRWAGAGTSPWPANDARPLILIALSWTHSRTRRRSSTAVLDAAAALPVRIMATRKTALPART